MNEVLNKFKLQFEKTALKKNHRDYYIRYLTNNKLRSTLAGLLLNYSTRFRGKRRREDK